MKRRTLALLVVVHVLGGAGLAPGCGSVSSSSIDAAAGAGGNAGTTGAAGTGEANPDGPGDASEAPTEDCRTTGCSPDSYCGGCNVGGRGATLVYFCIPRGAAC